MVQMVQRLGYTGRAEMIRSHLLFFFVVVFFVVVGGGGPLSSAWKTVTLLLKFVEQANKGDLAMAQAKALAKATKKSFDASKNQADSVVIGHLNSGSANPVPPPAPKSGAKGRTKNKPTATPGGGSSNVFGQIVQSRSKDRAAERDSKMEILKFSMQMKQEEAAALAKSNQEFYANMFQGKYTNVKLSVLLRFV